jgi:hypothetical protein
MPKVVGSNPRGGSGSTFRSDICYDVDCERQQYVSAHSGCLSAVLPSEGLGRPVGAIQIPQFFFVTSHFTSLYSALHPVAKALLKATALHLIKLHFDIRFKYYNRITAERFQGPTKIGVVKEMPLFALQSDVSNSR